MSTGKISKLNPGLLPEGAWKVDPGTSEVRFTARGSWGLAKVNGTFGAFDGTLTVDASGNAEGKLVIDAKSIDTNNRKRDDHLRSDDFFAVARYPEVTFELSGIAKSAAGQVEARGFLQVKNARLNITAPVEIRVSSEDRFHLSTELSVERGAVGLTWNKMGILRGQPLLSGSVTLVRA